jgi:hypothetical protein
MMVQRILLPFHKVSWWYKGYFYPFTKFHDGTKDTSTLSQSFMMVQRILLPFHKVSWWYKGYFYPFTKFHDGTKDTSTLSQSFMMVQRILLPFHKVSWWYKGYFYIKKEKSHTELLLIYILNKPAKFLV